MLESPVAGERLALWPSGAPQTSSLTKSRTERNVPRADRVECREGDRCPDHGSGHASARDRSSRWAFAAERAAPYRLARNPSTRSRSMASAEVIPSPAR